MPKSTFPRGYMILYAILSILEFTYIFLVWSPYGKPSGKLNKLFTTVKNNLNAYVVFGILFLMFFSIFFPGIGYMAFVVTLYRVAQMCCKPSENFGDGLKYGWGRYYPDHAKFFNQGHIERDQDMTRAAYSSAVGDTEDAYRIAKLAEFENRISHTPIHAMRRKVLVYEKDGCGYGKWIIPETRDNSVLGQQYHLCNNGCDKCAIKKYGSIFESLSRPRPLYTTSTLAKEVGSA